GVPRHKHIIWDAIEVNLFPPHFCPYTRIGVDMPQYRRLRANLCTRTPEARDSLFYSFCTQFYRVAEMRHDGQIETSGSYSFKKLQEIVGIGIRQKFIRPETERFGTNSDGLNIRFAVIRQKGFNVLRKYLVRHNHRVATGEEQVGDFL